MMASGKPWVSEGLWVCVCVSVVEWWVRLQLQHNRGGASYSKASREALGLCEVALMVVRNSTCSVCGP